MPTQRDQSASRDGIEARRLVMLQIIQRRVRSRQTYQLAKEKTQLRWNRRQELMFRLGIALALPACQLGRIFGRLAAKNQGNGIQYNPRLTRPGGVVVIH